MLPDTGERYLSTALFEGISDGRTQNPEARRGPPTPRGSDPVRLRRASGPSVALPDPFRLYRGGVLARGTHCL